MKMWMVAACVALGLAACGTSGGGLRNDAYKQITEKKEEVVAHFNVDGSAAAAKVANGFYRKWLGKTADGSFVVQDFYSRNDLKQSDPFLITNERGKKIDRQSHIDHSSDIGTEEFNHRLSTNEITLAVVHH